MLGSWVLLVDGNGTATQQLSLVVPALCRAEERQIVQGLGGVGVYLSHVLLLYDQSTLIQGFGQAQLALPSVDFCQGIQADCRLGMLGSQALFTDGECSLQQGKSLGILPSFSQVGACLMQQRCGLWCDDRFTF